MEEEQGTPDSSERGSSEDELPATGGAREVAPEPESSASEVDEGTGTQRTLPTIPEGSADENDEDEQSRKSDISDEMFMEIDEFKPDEPAQTTPTGTSSVEPRGDDTVETDGTRTPVEPRGAPDNQSPERNVRPRLSPDNSPVNSPVRVNHRGETYALPAQALSEEDDGPPSAVSESSDDEEEERRERLRRKAESAEETEASDYEEDFPTEQPKYRDKFRKRRPRIGIRKFRHDVMEHARAFFMDRLKFDNLRPISQTISKEKANS